MKKIVFAFAAALSCILMTVTASAYNVSEKIVADGTKRLYDDAGLIDEADEAALEEYLYNAAIESELNVAVVLTDDVGSDKSDRGVVDYADLYYEKLYGMNTDGVLLLINNDTKYDYISTSGRAIKLFTDSRIDSAFDYFYDDIVDGNYYKAIIGFADRVELFSSLGAPSNQYDYPEDFIDKVILYFFSGQFIGFLLMAAAVIFIVYAIIKAPFRIKKQPASSYLNKASVYFTRKTDTFIRTYTTRHKVTTSSSSSRSGSHHSSGRSSTHRSSSGGRHGGGGRHR